MKKKLNSKGITLVELIVSFVIVAVAVIYFYNMLTSVTKMYANARKDINHEAKVNYVYRLFEAADISVNEDIDCASGDDYFEMLDDSDTCEKLVGNDGPLKNIVKSCELEYKYELPTVYNYNFEIIINDKESKKYSIFRNSKCVDVDDLE